MSHITVTTNSITNKKIICVDKKTNLNTQNKNYIIYPILKYDPNDYDFENKYEKYMINKYFKKYIYTNNNK
jgi:hypothetical protein